LRQAGASGQRPKEANGGRIVVQGTAEEEKGAEEGQRRSEGRRKSGGVGRSITPCPTISTGESAMGSAKRRPPSGEGGQGVVGHGSQCDE